VKIQDQNYWKEHMGVGDKTRFTNIISVGEVDQSLKSKFHFTKDYKSKKYT
jgi:hypothetical protein